MPITFTVCNQPLSKVSTQVQARDDDAKKAGKPLVVSGPFDSQLPRVPNYNGFVNTIVTAYNQHHHLILRPDDVWLAIQAQFAAYMELHGEKLRSKFVSHEGKKELSVTTGGTLLTAPYQQICTMLADEVGKNIKDKSVKDWVIPAFTTTRPADTVIGAICLMSSMQKYFAYKAYLLCGLPQVTLEGDVKDWAEIETRASRLPEFDSGDQYMDAWYKLLKPILANFTASAAGKPDVEWWNRVCHRYGGGSGPRYLSGWVTAFCVFSDEGRWQGSDLEISEGWDSVQTIKSEWPFVNTNSIPSGSVSVNLVVDDNGIVYQTVLEAGHMAFQADGDKIRPSAEWTLRLAGEQDAAKEKNKK